MQTKITQAFFDTVGQKYEDGFGHDQGLIDFVKRSLLYLSHGPHTRVPDAGQGTGKPTSSLVAQTGCKVHGIDISPTMAQLAASNVPSGSFEVINMLDYRPDECFDAVFAIFSHFQFRTADVPALMRRYADWVKPGGFLFIGTMAADDFPDGQFVPETPDKSIGRVTRRFMGVDSRLLVITRAGWEALLRREGFEVLQTDMVPFQAPPEAGCDVEPHYYLACRKNIFRSEL